MTVNTLCDCYYRILRVIKPTLSQTIQQKRLLSRINNIHVYLDVMRSKNIIDKEFHNGLNIILDQALVIMDNASYEFEYRSTGRISAAIEPAVKAAYRFNDHHCDQLNQFLGIIVQGFPITYGCIRLVPMMHQQIEMVHAYVNTEFGDGSFLVQFNEELEESVVDIRTAMRFPDKIRFYLDVLARTDLLSVYRILRRSTTLWEAFSNDFSIFDLVIGIEEM